MIQTFKEFKVVYNGNNIIDKKPTLRETVRISQQTADVNNSYSKSTGLLYELAEDKKPDRTKLEAKANELGIEFRASIGDAKLLDKINLIEPEFKI